MGENTLTVTKSNPSVPINNGKEASVSWLEQIVIIIEKTISRYGGQMVKSVESTSRSTLELSNKTVVLLEQSLATDSYLVQEIASLKEVMVAYTTNVNQVIEHFSKQLSNNLANTANTASSPNNATPVTKEQLNQAINFLVSKIATNDLSLLIEQINKNNLLITNHIASSQNSQNKDLQVIITQLSTLQKQQQSQQIQLEKVINYVVNGHNGQATATITNNSSNGNSPNPNTNNTENTTLSKLGSKLSSQVKAVIPNVSANNSQQPSNRQLEEKYYSIPKTPYQISAKALKQIAIVLIGIVVLAIYFK